MPPLESKDRKQKAVLCERAGTDSYGKPLRAGPEEIDVRWNIKRSNMLSPEGEKIVVDATVVVYQAIPMGSFMWLGELEDWYGTGSGGLDSEVMEVVAQDVTKDLKGRHTARTVGLKKFRDTLPNIG